MIKKIYDQINNANQMFIFYKLYLKGYIGGGGANSSPIPGKKRV